MKLAPVIIFTFNRLEHTKKTIEALKDNVLAEETEVFIFSDGARNNEEEEKVRDVRNYISTVSGFKSVVIKESKNNKGLARTVISGVSEIINEYGKVIVLEDDLITSKYFIQYMNIALELYEDRNDIWSISGYMPNLDIPSDYLEEVCLIRRGASWGWGTWKNKWELNDWDVKDYKEFILDKNAKKRFCEAGNDMLYMLEDQMKGRIDSWAIRWGYSQFKNEMWTVYPVKSLIKNIGTDLSGTHSSKTHKYDVTIDDKLISINYDIKVDERILDSFKKFYDLNMLGFIALFIKRIGLYKPARKLRNKLINLSIR